MTKRSNPMSNFSVRLDTDTLNTLDSKAKELGTNRNHLIRLSIAKYLNIEVKTNQDIMIDKVRNYLDKGFKTSYIFKEIEKKYQFSRSTIYKYIQKAKEDYTPKSESYFYSKI
tara:strand:+ start:120 stop:458 length:339 start_codon:yes stop_codon:yes gene_type:complete